MHKSKFDYPEDFVLASFSADVLLPSNIVSYIMHTKFVKNPVIKTEIMQWTIWVPDQHSYYGKYEWYPSVQFIIDTKYSIIGRYKIV